MIIYEGPSMIDGSPIIGIVTGLTRPSKNPKTGPMAQLWILSRDQHPLEAIATGEDSSVCGDCPLRGVLGKERACYVNVGQAPGQVWETYQRGRYDIVSPAFIVPTSRSESLRLSAYGDPAALPLDTIEQLLQHWRKWTGYTHQWRTRPDLAEYCMASTETAEDAREAQAMGWRTFSLDPASPDSIECANTSAGITCAECGLCDGTRSGSVRSITIAPHGSGARHITTS